MTRRRSACVAVTIVLLTAVGTTVGVAGTVTEFATSGAIVDWTFADRPGGGHLLVLVRPAPADTEEGARERRGPVAVGASGDDEVPPDAGNAPEPMPPCPGQGPADQVLELWSMPTDRGAPTRLREDLPASGRSLRVSDLDGDGADETTLDTADGRWVLGATATEDRLLLSGGGLVDLPDGRTVRVRRGALSVWARGEDGLVRRSGSAPVPVRVALGRRVATVWSPGVEVIGESDDGRVQLATQVEAVGTRRLRVHVFVVAEDGAVEVRECWARLPEPEDVLESWVVPIGGTPHLVVTTKEAGRLGLFVEKRIRAFALRADRTRLGDPPVFATTSRMNLWQTATLTTPDVDRDGRADLAFGYWKGLKDDRVVVDVYAGEDDGGFSERARSAGFDVDGGVRGWVLYGRDLDGDGGIDLVVRAGDELRLHPGRTGALRGPPVDKRGQALPLPEGLEDAGVAVEVALGARSGVAARSRDRGPRALDVTGDGHPELVLVAKRERHDVLVVVRVPSRD